MIWLLNFLRMGKAKLKKFSFIRSGLYTEQVYLKHRVQDHKDLLYFHWPLFFPQSGLYFERRIISGHEQLKMVLILLFQKDPATLQTALRLWNPHWGQFSRTVLTDCCSRPMLPVQSPRGSIPMAMDSSLPGGSAQSGGKTFLWEMEESKSILINIANFTQISTVYLMWFNLVPWEIISQTHFSWKKTSKKIESSLWLIITLSNRLWH